MWQSKSQISREWNDKIGSAKGSQISEIYWGEVGKKKRVDVYLEVRKRRGHIFFEWNKCLCSFPIKSVFLSPFRIRKRFHFDFWFIFTTDGEYVLSIYLLIVIFIDWKHRWRNTIYIQEIEIRFYVISLGMMILFSAHKKYLLHIYATPRRKISKTWCFSSNMSIKTNYTTILRQ